MVEGEPVLVPREVGQSSGEGEGVEAVVPAPHPAVGPGRCGARYGLVQVGAGAGVAEPLPVRPNEVLACAATVPLYGALVTVTLLPLTVSVPFQSWLIVCPLGSVQRTVQAFMVAASLLVTVTSAWNPPGHLLVTV